MSAAPYDRIGVRYDATRRADPQIAARLLRYLDAPPAARCLDLACGTGNYTAHLCAAGLRVTGLDQSPLMLAAAAAKGLPASWVHGDAAALPFADLSFDRAVCTLAIHHFADLPAAFRELHRVLRHGPFVLLTATAEATGAFWLTRYFPVTMARAIAHTPRRETIVHALHDAGFTELHLMPYAVTPDLQDLFLYAGKHRPAIYLDPAVRAGISAFSNLADPAEVQAGCARLEADLRSGALAEVLADAAGSAEDYLFITAVKP